jgi:hypothetical protein
MWNSTLTVSSNCSLQLEAVEWHMPQIVVFQLLCSLTIFVGLCGNVKWFLQMGQQTGIVDDLVCVIAILFFACLLFML